MADKPGVFISHIHEDEQTALTLEAFVRKTLLGALDVFNVSNRRSILPGDPWRDVIVARLRNSKTTLVLASRDSVTHPWVNFESGGAWLAGNRVIPCCIAGMSPPNLPPPLGHLQAVTLGTASGLESLIHHLAELCHLDIPPEVDYEGAAANFRRLWQDTLGYPSNLTRLFVQETGYAAADALNILKHSMKLHDVSKWGVAVPIVEGRYNLLLGFHFSERYLGADAHFLPPYAVDAQDHINIRILSEDLSGEVLTELVWGAGRTRGVEGLLDYMGDELRKRGLHPPNELDINAICRRTRDTLMFRGQTRIPGTSYRTNINATICLVGDELLVTTDGIEHATMHNSKPIPLFAAFRRAGLLTEKAVRKNKGLNDDYYYKNSGFQDHPDLERAITAIRTLYRSRFLDGLYDGSLKRDRP